MTMTAVRGARAWLNRRSAPSLLAVTTAGLAAGGLGYALWIAVASLSLGGEDDDKLVPRPSH